MSLLLSRQTNTGWLVEPSQPLRVKARAYAAAQIASGLIIDPFILTQEEAVTADRWVQPFTQPFPIRRRLLTGAQQHLTYGDVTTVAGELVTLDKYYKPLVDPVRVPRRLSTGSQQYLAFVKAAPFAETVSYDRWAFPLSEPVRRRGLRPHYQQYHIAGPANPIVAFHWQPPLALPIPKRYVAFQQYLALVKADPFPETISTDRWWMPYSEPQRSRLRLATAAQQYELFWPVNPTDIVPEVVTMDKWYKPLVDPQRQPRRLREYQAFFYSNQLPFPPWDWRPPLEKPQLLARRRIVDGYPTHFYGRPPLVHITWFMQLGEPRRERPALPKAWLQQYEFASYTPLVTQGWLVELSTPRRFPRALPTGLLPTLFFPDPVIIPTVSWFAPFSEPKRFPIALAVHQHMSNVFLNRPVYRLGDPNKPLFRRSNSARPGTNWKGRS